MFFRSKGLAFSENIYSELVWGSAAGTTPVINIPEAELAWVWQSQDYVTGTTPYSLTTDIAVAQVELQPFDITAGGKILYDINYTMTDALSAAPITITLVNSTASYAGS